MLVLAGDEAAEGVDAVREEVRLEKSPCVAGKGLSVFTGELVVKEAAFVWAAGEAAYCKACISR